MPRLSYRTVAALLSLAVVPSAFAEDAFSDVPKSHPIYEAVEYLRSQGFVTGYEDGTFRPDRQVNRAEAVKLIMAPLAKPEELNGFGQPTYSDVPADAWYLPYVELARSRGVIDGPPAKTAFNGTAVVLKSEFIKMLLLAQRADPVGAFSEIRLPLSSDVGSPDDWFYPYMRYAITSSMTMIGADGLLHPARQITRGDTALLLHRYLLYTQGRRTQALLSEAESEILVILGTLERNDIEQAEYASARALLAARGAHASKPDEPDIQGALKITEAFRGLVRAFRAGLDQDYDNVIKLTGDAWHLAARAKELSADMGALADQVQKIAQSMANNARELKAGDS